MKTSIILAFGVTAAIIPQMWGSSPEASFDFGRDGGWIVFALFCAWLMISGAGIVFGLPLLMVLRRLGLDHRLEVLIFVGLIAGSLFMALLGLLITASVMLNGGLLSVSGTAGGGAAGASWWLFTTKQRVMNA